MEIKLQLNVDPKKMQHELEARVAKETEVTIRNVLAELFTPRGRWNQKEGVLHEIVRKRVEDYVLSDKFTERLDKWIERNLDEALDHSGTKVLNWAARKRLFKALEKGLEQNRPESN